VPSRSFTRVSRFAFASSDAPLQFSSFFALPEKDASFSACGISSAFTAAMVFRISPRPCSESNGASVANTHLSVPKKA